MNLLFVVVYAPNPVRVRPYQFIRTLLARGNRVTVATLWTSPEEKADIDRLVGMGATVLAEPIGRMRTATNLAGALFGADALQAAWSWQPDLFAALCQTLARERFDAIHVEHLRGSRYALGLQEFVAAGKARGKPPVIWDSVDSITLLFAQARQLSQDRKTLLMTRLDFARTQRAEGILAGAFPRVVVTSHADRDSLLALAARQSDSLARAAERALCVIPPGVDLEAFPFRSSEGRDPASIVLSGKMSYHANAAAASFLVEEIMPVVWKTHPNVQVRLVGKDPGREMLEWAQRDPARVIVTGAVPSMGAALGGATLAAAPIRYGAGVQNKVLEAMACGTPVVATSIAAAPLDAQPGVHLEVADSAEAFAGAITRLLDDPGQRAVMARAARAYIESHHSWDAATAALEETYRAAAAP